MKQGKVPDPPPPGSSSTFPTTRDMGKDTGICSSRTAQGISGLYLRVLRYKEGAASYGVRQRNNLAG